MLNVNKIGMNFGKITVAAGCLFYLGACTPEGSEEMNKESGEETNAPEDEAKSMGESVNRKVFYTIPSPLELTAIIKKAGAKYDKSVLNSTDKASNYVTQTDMALNLGVYGADLSYASIFEQQQETMYYFKAAKQLADELGITSAFGESTLTRIQNNLDNKDSLVSIISDSYWETDAYLKENKQSSISGLVITGAWIEGMYVSCKLSEMTKNNTDIKKRIGEQKLTLDNLIAMLNSYKNPEVADVVADLIVLKKAFDPVEINYKKLAPKVDTEARVTTLNTTSTVNITYKQLAVISEKIDSIRTKIVK